MKTIAVLVGVLACFCLLLFAVIRLRQSRLDSLPREFEGRIVDKWAGYSETDEGSSRYYRVVVEVEGQNRYTVPVDHNIYQQAQVGMRLRRSDKGFEVIRTPSG